MSSNFSKGVNTLIEIAEQGNTDMQIRLAEHYYEGNGVPRDIDEAMKWRPNRGMLQRSTIWLNVTERKTSRQKPSSGIANPPNRALLLHNSTSEDVMKMSVRFL